MSSFIAKINICDRCGILAYSKKTGERSTDGGYAQWDEYTNFDEGWTNDTVAGVYHTLCPACHEKWMRIGRDFLSEHTENN